MIHLIIVLLEQWDMTDSLSYETKTSALKEFGYPLNKKDLKDLYLL